MSKRKRRRPADDRPASRRYVESVVRRARDDVIRAVLWATRSEPVVPMTPEEIRRRLGDEPR